MFRHKGFTMVEMMTAMVISMLLLAGVVQIFISSRVTYHFLEGQATLLENGRFAIHILQKHGRMAGLQPTNPSRSTRPNGAALLPAVDPNTTMENGDTVPDSIGFTYASPEGTDCSGAVVAQPATNVFSILETDDGEKGLFCNNALIVKGVSNMQILYGEDTAGVRTADRYVTFDQLSSTQIRAIQVGLTLYDARETETKVQAKPFTTTIMLRNN